MNHQLVACSDSSVKRLRSRRDTDCVARNSNTKQLGAGIVLERHYNGMYEIEQQLLPRMFTHSQAVSSSVIVDGWGGQSFWGADSGSRNLLNVDEHQGRTIELNGGYIKVVDFQTLKFAILAPLIPQETRNRHGWH